MDLENILGAVLGAGSGGTVKQLGQQFGLSDVQAKGAIEKLLPALNRGIAKNAATEDGLSSLLSALSKGNHSRYMDDPATLQQNSTTDDGNRILGHIFGSKDISRNVAGHAARETGLDSTILKKMLPVVATLAMGALSNKAQAGGLLGNVSREQQGGSNSARSLITSLLDADQDGSVIDDVMGMAQRFF